MARDRIKDARPIIPLGKRFWPLCQEEKDAIQQLFGREEVRKLITSIRARDDDDSIKVLDAAFWVKGCSSLGRLRLAVIVGIGKPPQGGDNLCLMDIKEAVEAAAPRYAEAKMPYDNAQRVVEGALHLAPHLGERMRAARFLGRAVFLRELLPEDLQIKLKRFTREEAMKAAGFLAAVVGRAHARQMDVSSRKQWRSELNRYRTKKLDAPSWLWSSVVELLVIHEQEYLEHCRKYALSVETPEIDE